MPDPETTCTLVLGSNLNGYSAVQELADEGVRSIVLADHSRGLAARSRRIERFEDCNQTSAGLLDLLERLHQSYEFIIPFPTSDLFVENLAKISDRVKDFCFIPFNPELVQKFASKAMQYRECARLGVPCPQTVFVEDKHDLGELDRLPLPIIAKPVSREDVLGKVWRSRIAETDEERYELRADIVELLRSGLSFIVSEVIPGPESNIYSYMAYRCEDGEILNEWTGRKLAQYPNAYGIFSTGSNQAPEVVAEQGRALVRGMGLNGLSQPEFKLDQRDGQYKLMEINLRAMMWHRTGNLAGVKLLYSQYLNALGATVPKMEQDKERDIHFIYLKHEIFNLVNRRGYFATFRRNLWGGDCNKWAIFSLRDPVPFLYDSLRTISPLLKRFAKRVGRKLRFGLK
ncbi:hypothetical protein N9A94_01235 [Akkermansiaceae bacterium]|nr:hypothetical protein [Akkermansiaceae bacterium]